MFTGIVQGKGEVVAINDQTDFRQYVIKLPAKLAKGIIIGASIANNGCCLTVTKVKGEWVHFDLMKETLERTNLATVIVGDFVNIERAAKFGDEIGGHLMSGHITCMAEVIAIQRNGLNCQMQFKLPKAYMKYILYKGFIGIDGASLTIGEVLNDTFTVYLIPETLQLTTLSVRSINDYVNIEIDPQTQAIVDTVEKVLASQQGNFK